MYYKRLWNVCLLCNMYRTRLTCYSACMNNTWVDPSGLDNTVDLFTPRQPTVGDRILAKLCVISGIACGLLSGAGFLLTVPNRAFRTTVIAVAIVSSITFIATLCLLGIRSVGQDHGRQTFLGQAVFVVSRVVLFLFLPCAILTLAIIAWALLTHQPGLQ